MYKNILIATDGSELATSAIQNGIYLAKSTGSKITAVNVSEPFYWFDPNMIQEAEPAYIAGVNQVAAKALAAVADAAKAAGVACETVHVEGQMPYLGIIWVANTKHCDLIVMTSDGRKGVSAFVLGSETVKVLTHSRIPVLVCH